MKTDSVSPVRASAGSGPEDVRLQVSGLRKSFGASKALQDCSFELRTGEVHAVVGENGSGKSTLVKILSGVQWPDAGEVTVTNRSPGPLRTPRQAVAAGVATVFQELLTVGCISILDNLWMGSDSLFRESLTGRQKRERAASALSDLLESPPDLDQDAESLSLSEQQACGIARALLREPRVLILDEATSALDARTRDRLFSVLAGLRREGVSVVFISHRMDEIDEVADRITVLRSGRSVASLERGNFTRADLIRHMTGSDHLTDGVAKRRSALSAGEARPLLRTRNLRLRPRSAPIDFDLRVGELVGIAGLDGHGQDEFLHSLWGEKGGAVGEVTRLTDGSEKPVATPREAALSGIGYLARERRREALFPTLSILENFGVRTIDRDTLGPILMNGRTRSRFEKAAIRLKIKYGNDRDQITTLSGGNQQKVAIARWLATAPEILLLNDPTRGIDINAKRDLYDLLTELAATGVGVVMNSTELDELIELMDRVLVFREGSIVAELKRDDLSRVSLVSGFFGQPQEGADA